MRKVLSTSSDFSENCVMLVKQFYVLSINPQQFSSNILTTYCSSKPAVEQSTLALWVKILKLSLITSNAMVLLNVKETPIQRSICLTLLVREQQQKSNKIGIEYGWNLRNVRISGVKSRRFVGIGRIPRSPSL